MIPLAIITAATAVAQITADVLVHRGVGGLGMWKATDQLSTAASVLCLLVVAATVWGWRL